MAWGSWRELCAPTRLGGAWASGCRGEADPAFLEGEVVEVEAVFGLAELEVAWCMGVMMGPAEML